MKHLVIRDRNRENITYSGSQFEGLENTGSKHLCVRTGVGDSGVKRYALTSTPLNDKYSKMKMRVIASGAVGKIAYIAQRFTSSSSSSSTSTRTETRTSQYISSQTMSTSYRTSLSTNTYSRSSLSTKTENRTSGYTSNRTSSYSTTKTNTFYSYYGKSITGTYLYSTTRTGTGYMYLNQTTLGSGSYVLGSSSTMDASVALVAAALSKRTTTTTYRGVVKYSSRSCTYTVCSVTLMGSNYTSHPLIYSITRTASGSNATYNASISKINTTITTNTTASSTRTSRYTSSSTVTSQYTSSRTLTTNSSSSIRTNTASRTSQYTSTDTVTASTSTITNNVNL